MKTAFRSTILRFCCLSLLLALGIALGGPRSAWAQFENKTLSVGSLSMIYAETGGQQEYWKDGYGLTWPTIYRQSVLRAGAFWIGAENWTSPDGEEYPAKIVHVGPRSTGYGEMFPIEFKTTSKFEPPVVMVDGIQTYYQQPDNDEVDPSIKADRMITSRVNTLLGVTLLKKVLAFSQQYHDNYHVQEYILTNTGNTDADPEIELPDQTVEGIYLHFQKRYVYGDRMEIPGSGWGANVMNDIVGDGMEDYEVDFNAQYTWLGNSQDSEYDPLAGPVWDQNPSWIPDEDTRGRLSAAAFVGTVALHADQSAADDQNDPTQPSMTGYIDADHPLTSGNSAFDKAKMEQEYLLISEAVGPVAGERGPHMYPHHADIVDLDGDFTTADGDAMRGKAGGWQSMFSYGPYTLAPGESVRIVIAEAMDGLNRKESILIGRAFKADAGGVRENADPEAPIWYDADGDGQEDPDEVMGKNDWWWTGRDSLFQTFERAIANYESGYNIPQPPMPPKTFTVTSSVDEILLEWTTYEGAAPPGGFEIYRGKFIVEGDWENLYQYERIATVPAQGGTSTYSYSDASAVRGINYFYYTQAVGAVNTDPTAMTPTGVPLKSNRQWTQTWTPATLKRPPGETTASFKIVPNPYNINADPEVRFPEEDRLGFLDVPGQCIIRIYTETGQLVRTLRHEDGSGDEFWNLTTEDRQIVVSGVYIAVVENLENGEEAVKKFVIVR